jgi:hypothetical protein
MIGDNNDFTFSRYFSFVTVGNTIAESQCIKQMIDEFNTMNALVVTDESIDFIQLQELCQCEQDKFIHKSGFLFKEVR